MFFHTPTYPASLDDPVEHLGTPPNADIFAYARAIVWRRANGTCVALGDLTPVELDRLYAFLTRYGAKLRRKRQTALFHQSWGDDAHQHCADQLVYIDGIRGQLDLILEDRFAAHLRANHSETSA